MIPPCIISIAIKEHLSQNERYLLATYTQNCNIPHDELKRVLSKTPNYNEATTNAQAEFLKGYSCPICITIKQWGLCTGDCKVKSPTDFFVRIEG
jgi:DNA primase large subunit